MTTSFDDDNAHLQTLQSGIKSVTLAGAVNPEIWFMSSHTKRSQACTWILVPEQCRATVRAHATQHEVHSIIPRLHGQLGGDPNHLEKTAHGSVYAPVHHQRFGNPLKNLAMRRHLQLSRWPEARFCIDVVNVLGQAPWKLEVRGTLHYREHETKLVVQATGSVSSQELRAQAFFSLPLRAVGIEPPRLLWLRVTDTVDVEVLIVAKGTVWPT